MELGAYDVEPGHRQARPLTAALSLQRQGRRMVVACCCLAACAAYLYRSARIVAAYHEASKNSVDGLRAAVALEKGAAQFHEALGQYLFLAAQQPDQAAAQFREAVALNPRATSAWVGLARCMQWRGNEAGEREALDHALAAEPRNPQVAWDAGISYLTGGDTEPALRNFRVVIANDPRMTSEALKLALKVASPLEVLDKAVPSQADAYDTYLRILMERHDSDTAARVWRRRVDAGDPIPRDIALPYIETLLGSHREAAAEKAWRDWLHVSKRTSVEDGNNGIFNGGFEEDSVDGGFDWRFVASTFAHASTDSTVFAGGARSLLVEFTGEVGDDAGVWQYAEVIPGRRYRFTVSVKSEELATVDGPQWAVRDAYTNQVLGTTPPVVGTTPWQEYSTTIEIPATTRLVRVGIIRASASTHIRGNFWSDGVTLVPVS